MIDLKQGRRASHLRLMYKAGRGRERQAAAAAPILAPSLGQGQSQSHGSLLPHPPLALWHPLPSAPLPSGTTRLWLGLGSLQGTEHRKTAPCLAHQQQRHSCITQQGPSFHMLCSGKEQSLSNIWQYGVEGKSQRLQGTEIMGSAQGKGRGFGGVRGGACQWQGRGGQEGCRGKKGRGRGQQAHLTSSPAILLPQPVFLLL